MPRGCGPSVPGWGYEGVWIPKGAQTLSFDERETRRSGPDESSSLLLTQNSFSTIRPRALKSPRRVMTHEGSLVCARARRTPPYRIQTKSSSFTRQALAVRRQSHLAPEERHKLASMQYRPPLPPSSIVRLISLFPPSIKPPFRRPNKISRGPAVHLFAVAKTRGAGAELAPINGQSNSRAPDTWEYCGSPETSPGWPPVLGLVVK
jgi:hypothetical protein